MSLTKATYSMIDGPVGNVKDFGAVGDGVANDTAAVQAAIDEICNAEGILLFPPGTYALSAPLTFPNKSFVIRGSGPTATNISEIPGSGQIKLFDMSGANGPSVVIEHMGFLGQQVVPVTAVTVYIFQHLTVLVLSTAGLAVCSTVSTKQTIHPMYGF